MDPENFGSTAIVAPAGTPEWQATNVDILTATGSMQTRIMKNTVVSLRRMFERCPSACFTELYTILYVRGRLYAWPCKEMPLNSGANKPAPLLMHVDSRPIIVGSESLVPRASVPSLAKASARRVRGSVPPALSYLAWRRLRCFVSASILGFGVSCQCAGDTDRNSRN